MLMSCCLTPCHVRVQPGLCRVGTGWVVGGCAVWPLCFLHLSSGSPGQETALPRKGGKAGEKGLGWFSRVFHGSQPALGIYRECCLPKSAADGKDNANIGRAVFALCCWLGHSACSCSRCSPAVLPFGCPCVSAGSLVRQCGVSCPAWGCCLQAASGKQEGANRCQLLVLFFPWMCCKDLSSQN